MNTHRTALLIPLLLAFTASAAFSDLAPIGLSEVGAQLLLNQTIGDNEATGSEQFGWAVAAGDFNGRGFADLAIAVPYYDGRRFACHSAGGNAGKSVRRPSWPSASESFSPSSPLLPSLWPLRPTPSSAAPS